MYVRMKNIKLILLLIILLGTACSPTGKRHPAWKEMPVVARMETVNGHPLTVASLDLLKDTMNLPLSALVEELQIVRLENREEALVEPGYVCMSDNYMLVVNWKTPCKLFRKDGIFVCKVGNIGLGTGEYKWIYDVQIDEKNGRIYLLQRGTREILSYNLEGKYEGSIPLHLPHPKMYVPKGVFQVDVEKNRVAVLSLPFSYLPNMAWVQDLEGNLCMSIPPRHLKLKPDFSNEIVFRKDAGQWSFHVSPFFELRKDTLYLWNLQDAEPVPYFTLDFGEKPICLHNYRELPLYFYGRVATSKQMTEDSYMSDQERYFIIDKETLKGGFCRIYNDWMCDEPIEGLTDFGGYYTENIPPGALLERIEEFLKECPEGDTPRKQRLLELKATIDRNDNNYIIYGKHRTRK